VDFGVFTRQIQGITYTAEFRDTYGFSYQGSPDVIISSQPTVFGLTITVTTPEPATLTSFGIGGVVLAAWGALRRRRVSAV
jgi:hypothetical protein